MNIWYDIPKRLEELVILNKTDAYIANQTSGWVVTYLREGKFYLNEERTEYVHVFDLDIIFNKATKILLNFYRQWNSQQKQNPSCEVKNPFFGN